MMPLRRMPAVDSAGLRALYRERFHHGLVVCADASAAEYPVHPGFRVEWGCLSIVAVRNGREEYRFEDAHRTLVVEDDVYLVLDACSRYSYRLRSTGTARCLMVSFPPWMVASARDSITNDLDREPDAVTLIDDEPAGMVGHLAPHDDIVTPELRRIERACLEGAVGPEWYRQQMAVLLTRVMRARLRDEARVARLSALRPSTRRELAQRVAVAADYIHQGYRHRLDLQTLARAAHLSPFHLLRAFKEIHGMTPQEFLQRKRVTVAKRLLATTRLSTPRVAARVGFKSRSSLYRWMRRVHGTSNAAGLGY